MSAPIDPNTYTTPFLLTKTLHREPYPFISPSNQQNSQKGKIIIITGAGSGLGAAAAKIWALASASGIVLAGRRLSALETVASELQSISPSTSVLCVKTDISSQTDVKNLFEKVKERFGRAADVLLNNAGVAEDGMLVAEAGVGEWWRTFEINLKGLYIMCQAFIQAHPNPKEATGTIITVSSGRAGLTIPGGSAYNISKLAEERLCEHIQMENPTLRVFTTMPGIAKTEMASDFWKPYALDHPDLTGMLALYLVQPRADYLKGCMVGVNWDVEEMEEFKDEIVEKKLLQTAWLPILPFGGGKGLGK